MNGQPPQFHSLVIKTTIKGISRSLWGWNAWKFRRCATLQRHVTRYRQGEPFHCVRWLMTKFLNNFQISRSQDVVNSENRLRIQLKLMGLKTSQSRDQSACPMNETISKICRWEWGHVTVTRDPIRWRCFPFQAESIQSDSFVFFCFKMAFHVTLNGEVQLKASHLYSLRRRSVSRVDVTRFSSWCINSALATSLACRAASFMSCESRTDVPSANLNIFSTWAAHTTPLPDVCQWNVA